MEGETIDFNNQVMLRQKMPNGQLRNTGAYFDPVFGAVGPTSLISLPAANSVPPTPPNIPFAPGLILGTMTLFTRPNGLLYAITSSGVITQIQTIPSA